MVLRKNNFEFDGKHFLQKRGTAIGTRMAPAYANIFMHDLESRLNPKPKPLAPVKPYLWLRYIDDIFMIWTAREEQHQEFLEWLISIMIPSSLHGTGQGKTLTILMSRLLIIMALLKPICIQSQLISISIYSVPRAIHRGVKKAFLMHRPLGSDVFVLRLRLLSREQLILRSF